MRFGVIVSREDTAGRNIASFLKPVLPSNMALHFIDNNQCFADSVGEIDADFFIFASLHKSVSKRPTLTVHPIGNWGRAEMGGRDNTLIPTLPSLIKNCLRALQHNRNENSLDFEVSLEATHHGPFLNKPALFVEIGSSSGQWGDKAAAKVVAESIVEGVAGKQACVNCVGLGGIHYPHDFTKLVLSTEFALGHICPKYALEGLDAALLRQAIEKSSAEKIILDWKGLGAEKERILKLVEQTGLEVLRVRPLLKQ